MRILLLVTLQHPWNDGWYYKAGFEQNGHTTVMVDAARKTGLFERVNEAIRDSRPHLLLHTKDELPAAAFHELRKRVRVVQWYPDPVIPDWLPQYVRSCDIFFTVAEGLVEEFTRLNPKSFWLTQAFEPSSFPAGPVTREDRAMFSSEVTFVGNLGSKAQYLSRRDCLKRILDEGFYLKWWGPKIPWKISNIPLLYGRLGRAYGGKFVWGEEHAKIARLSGIYLGLDSMPCVRKSVSERIYIAVGCGAFYLCQHVEGIEEVMKPDREIVTFRSYDEMVDKISYYLPRKEQRKAISEEGRARVLKDHTYSVRIRQMISIITSVLGDVEK